MSNETTFVLLNNHTPKRKARRWNVFLFRPDDIPAIVAKKVSTRAALLAVARWDYRERDNCTLVQWPSDVPTPAEWGAIEIG
jgi:hypothetical protein